MRAVTRLGNALLAIALALAPAVALAQQSPTQSTDAVGPSGLQNFSLSGTVTRPADQAPAAASKPQNQPSKAATPPVSRTTPETVAASPPAARPTVKASPVQRAPQATRQSSPPPASTPAANDDMGGLGAAPSLPPAAVPTPAPAIATTPPAAFAPPPSSPASSGHGGFPLLPWLFAALALGAGGAFLLWRNRLRHAVPAGPLFDLFSPAEPVAEAAAPAPAPAPSPARPTAVAPQPKPAPISSGVVSTGLRPWIDIGFHPQRCILEDQRLTLEFEVELFNSGSSPARGVLAEAIMLNAGPTQDGEIDAFFANPVGAGERIEVIQPLKRMTIRTQLTVPRDRIQAYEVAGRQVFVVLVAFNVLYRLTSGEAQTSIAYLLGRDGQGDKLAPFRLDLGPRIFRGLGTRPLPNGVRR